MTSEQKVKRLWPKAEIRRETVGPSRYGMQRHYRVIITLGRYAYGKTPTRAWKSAWESITQNDDLSKGDRG